MSTISLLGLCLLALHGAPQDAGLSKPPVDEQTRKPAVETTVVIHDVNDIVEKMAPGTTPDEPLEKMLEPLVQPSERAVPMNGWSAPKAEKNAPAKVGLGANPAPGPPERPTP